MAVSRQHIRGSLAWQTHHPAYVPASQQNARIFSEGVVRSVSPHEELFEVLNSRRFHG